LNQVLKYILKKYGVNVDWIYAAQFMVRGEHGNEPSSSIKGGEFFDCLKNDSLVRTFASWSGLVKSGNNKEQTRCSEDENLDKV
jgi:hypothetical protein